MNKYEVIISELCCVEGFYSMNCLWQMKLHSPFKFNELVIISSLLLLEWTVRVERAELGQTQWPWAYKKREQPDKVHACVNQTHIRQIRAVLKSRQKVGHL